jgi:hypothetical protein
LQHHDLAEIADEIGLALDRGKSARFAGQHPGSTLLKALAVAESRGNGLRHCASNLAFYLNFKALNIPIASWGCIARLSQDCTPRANAPQVHDRSGVLMLVTKGFSGQRPAWSF